MKWKDGHDLRTVLAGRAKAQGIFANVYHSKLGCNLVYDLNRNRLIAGYTPGKVWIDGVSNYRYILEKALAERTPDDKLRVQSRLHLKVGRYMLKPSRPLPKRQPARLRPNPPCVDMALIEFRERNPV